MFVLTDGRENYKLETSSVPLPVPVAGFLNRGCPATFGSSRLNLDHDTRFDHHVRVCRTPLSILISLCASPSPRVHFGQRVWG